MVKAPYVDKDGLRKGAWSEEEDNKLRAYVVKYGHWNWRLLPKFADLQRCGKSCRLRWVNYLKPDVKRGVFSEEERDAVVKLHQQLGNKWSAIAANLPGRSDNDIKNYWQTHLHKDKGQRSCEVSSNKVKKASRIRHRKNTEEYSSTGSDVTNCVDQKSCELFILESSTSVSNTAFEWDLNL